MKSLALLACFGFSKVGARPPLTAPFAKPAQGAFMILINRPQPNGLSVSFKTQGKEATLICQLNDTDGDNSRSQGCKIEGPVKDNYRRIDDWVKFAIEVWRQIDAS